MEELAETRKALLVEARRTSRKLLVFFAVAAVLFLVSLLSLEPWSGDRLGFLPAHLTALLYGVFAITLAQVCEHYEVGEIYGGLGGLVSFFSVMAVFSAAVAPVVLLLEYSFADGGNVYIGLGFLVLALTVGLATFIYSQRLRDKAEDISSALTDLEPIALDCCQDVLAWREAYPEIAKYQSLVATQGRMLTAGEYCEMSSLAETLKEEEAARKVLAEQEQACEQLRRPLQVAVA